VFVSWKKFLELACKAAGGPSYVDGRADLDNWCQELSRRLTRNYLGRRRSADCSF
jgi:hypothetical protein